MTNPRFDPNRFGPPPPPAEKTDQEIDAINDMSFDERLDATHDWPCAFVFKFIIRPPQLFDFQKLFPEETWTTRESSGGKYVCVTMEKHVGGSREVLEVYARARHIPGVMML